MIWEGKHTRENPPLSEKPHKPLRNEMGYIIFAPVNF
jgi:hypothetical protein